MSKRILNQNNKQTKPKKKICDAPAERTKYTKQGFVTRYKVKINLKKRWTRNNIKLSCYFVITHSLF